MAAELGGADTGVQLLRDGGVVTDLTVPVGDALPISFYSDTGFGIFYANQTLQIALTNGSGSPGPENISVVVAGYRVGD
jgi:hypothetical protein